MRLLALALLALPSPAQDGAAAGLRAVVTAPQTVQLGAPFELRVELEHAAGVRPTLLPDAVGEAWAVLAEHGAATRPGAEGRASTTVRWTLVALEPLEDALPQLMASLADGSLEAPFVDSAGSAGGITVTGVLAPGEDSARPPHGFRAAPPAARPLPWWTWALLLAALAVAGLVAWRRRAARATLPAASPTPLERLAAIDPRALSGPAEVQAAYYELTAAVRRGIDARLGADRSGCTDDEWLRALGSSAELAEEERAALADLLRACEGVKYGGEHPTHWAVQETLERARTVLAGALSEPQGVAP